MRPEFVKEVRQQIRNYKKFKKLIEEWIELGIEYSRLFMKSEIERGKQQEAKNKTKRGRS